MIPWGMVQTMVVTKMQLKKKIEFAAAAAAAAAVVAAAQHQTRQAALSNR